MFHILLSEAWLFYKTDKKLNGYSEHTLKSYNIQTNLLIRYFGDVNIKDIELTQLKEYLIAQNHLKPASIGHRIRFIRSFFRWANEEDIISKNISVRLKEPKLGIRIPKALTEEEIEILRDGCVSLLEHVLVEFLYTTGTRVGEVIGLNKNSINWEQNSTIVIGKGNKEREVYFNIRCSIWLKRYLRKRNDTDFALFVTERSPHRISIAEIRYIIKRIAKRTNINNVYPHKLRHSYATHLLNNGAPLEGIQTLLGHQKIETTKLYCNLSGPRRKEIYQKYFR